MTRFSLSSLFQLRTLFGTKARPSNHRCIPQLTWLEERDVPATFFVDPDASASNQTFNDNRPGAVTTGLTFSSTATPGANLFNDLDTAIIQSNQTAGANTIELSNGSLAGAGVIAINSNPNTTFDITNSVTFVGTGAGGSIVQPANSETGVAVLAVDGAGVNVSFSAISFYGSGQGFDASGNVVGNGASPVGTFLSYRTGTSGTLNGVVFSGIYDTGFKGAGVSVSGAGTSVTIENSTFTSIGQTGVFVDAGASVDLLGNTYTGKGAGDFVDYFAQIVNGSTAVIGGNKVSGNTGVTATSPPASSAAVSVSDNGGQPSSAQIFGNSFTGNVIGVQIGDSATDTSTATLSYNNIVDNQTGLVTVRSTSAAAIDAENSWWGFTSGPYNQHNNPAGKGNAITNGINFYPVWLTALPVLSSTTQSGYLQKAMINNATVGEAGTPNQPVFRTADVSGQANSSPTPNPYASTSTRTAVGDVTGDSVADQIIGSGAGVPGSVTVIDGKTGQALVQFSVLGGFSGGVNVAVGDFLHNNVNQIAVTADVGGGPRIEIYTIVNGQAMMMANFFAFPDEVNFRGGLRIAAGDFSGNGFDDLAVTFGPGGGPRVRILNGKTLFSTPTGIVPDFFVGDPSLRIGQYVAVGDVNGDGTPDLAVTFGTGGSPIVQIFNGATLDQAGAGLPPILSSFYGGDPNSRAGLRVSARDVNFDGKADVIVGYGIGGSSQARVYYDPSGVFGIPTPNTSFDVYGSPSSGVYVG